MHGVRLPWARLPRHVRGWVAEVLGGPVVDAETQPAGFSPGSADRVRTAAGARAFVKAVSPDQNPRTPDLHRREIGVLRTLADVPQVPSLRAAHDDGGWVALVVEDVEGRHPALPWDDADLAAALRAVTSTSGRPAPRSWPALEEELAGEMSSWSRLRAAAEDPASPAAATVHPWCLDRAEELEGLALTTLPRLAGDRVVHSDLRADNLLLEPDGTVRLVDWPWASRGAPWFDAASLLVNVRWSGDLDVRRHLRAVHDLGATPQDVLGLVAGLAGFFTEVAASPPAPGLPTLRTFQAEQGRAAVALLQELWPTG